MAKKIATIVRPSKIHTLSFVSKNKSEAPANKLRNIHVSLDVLSTLLPLQQGNLYDSKIFSSKF